MEVLFKDIDLEDLICKGSSSNKFYKQLSRNKLFMQRLIDAYNQLRNAKNISDLYKFRRFNYEPLQTNLKGLSSIRIGYNEKYRLLFEEFDNGIKIVLIEISKHYGSD